MSNYIIYKTGIFSYGSTVEVTNRQGCVEYKVLDGYCSESDIRSRVGNEGRDTYSYYYNGYYHTRKECLSRLQRDIDETKDRLHELEFALKVTRKRNWIKVN